MSYINRSENSYVVPEIEFRLFFKKDLWRIIKNFFNNKSLKLDVDLLVSQIYKYKHTYKYTLQYVLDSIDKDEFKHKISENFRKFPKSMQYSVLLSITFLFCKKNKKKTTCFGAKYPVFPNFSFDLFQKTIDSKFVFLLRNPIDIYSSDLKKKYFLKKGKSKFINSSFIKPLLIFYVIFQFYNTVKSYERIKKLKPSNVCLFRYNDVVENPQKIKNKIKKFLNLKFERSTDLKIDKIDSSFKKSDSNRLYGISKIEIFIIKMFTSRLIKKYNLEFNA